MFNPGLTANKIHSVLKSSIRDNTHVARPDSIGSCVQVVEAGRGHWRTKAQHIYQQDLGTVLEHGLNTVSLCGARSLRSKI